MHSIKTLLKITTNCCTLCAGCAYVGAAACLISLAMLGCVKKSTANFVDKNDIHVSGKKGKGKDMAPEALTVDDAAFSKLLRAIKAKLNEAEDVEQGELLEIGNEVAEMNGEDTEESAESSFSKAIQPIIAQFLQQQGSNATINTIKNRQGGTFLHYCVGKMKVEQGVCKSGFLPNDKISLLRLLIAGFEANVNAVDQTDKTALHYAVANQSSPIVTCLLDNTTNAIAADAQGQTPWHAAGTTGSTIIIELLAPHVTDVNVQDKAGKTILHHAAAKGHIGVVNCLKNKYKVNPGLTDNTGKKASDHGVQLLSAPRSRPFTGCPNRSKDKVNATTKPCPWVSPVVRGNKKRKRYADDEDDDDSDTTYKSPTKKGRGKGSSQRMYASDTDTDSEEGSSIATSGDEYASSVSEEESSDEDDKGE